MNRRSIETGQFTFRAAVAGNCDSGSASGISKPARRIRFELTRSPVSRQIWLCTLLIETAKANGIEPHAYLTHLYTELPRSSAVDHFEALLPWNVKRVLARKS